MGERQIRFDLPPIPIRLEYPLANDGAIIDVEISVASKFANTPDHAPLVPFRTFALLDTGASHCAISEELAIHLGLAVIGETTVSSFGGTYEATIHLADISFPDSTLGPVSNLGLTTCQIAFSLLRYREDPEDYTNYSLAIGRDVLAGWNVVWDGPSSTVIISD